MRRQVLTALAVAAAAVSAALLTQDSGHHCTSKNTTLSCQLQKQPPAVRSLPTVKRGFSVLQGIDFAWSKFSPQSAGSFGASYAGHDLSKGWSSSLIREYHAAGRGTVAVFEDGATNAAGGCSQGRSDAAWGERMLASWGYPNSHLDLAIDFDASGSQVYSYFACANAEYPGLIGAYGGYFPLQYLCAKGVIHKSWATYAWSRGLWPPASCAPLEQYQNGSSFDHDRAIASDYGQFPTPGPPPPPPDPYKMFDKTVRHFGKTGDHASEYNTTKTWDQQKCQNPAKRRVCVTSHYHLGLLAGRLWSVAHHPLKNGQPTWGLYDRGARFQGLWKRYKAASGKCFAGPVQFTSCP